MRDFRFWCQKVLPLVYDDSLSYYELLCKVVDYLNNVIHDLNSISDTMNTLDNYVRNYFKNLNVQDEINNKLDTMARSGELSELIGYTNFFSGTKIICYGDSTTAGVSDNDSSYVDEPYPTVVKNILRANVINAGIAGATASSTHSPNWEAEIANNPIRDADYCIISFGINDWSKNVPLSKFESDYEETLTGLMSSNMECKFVLMSPAPTKRFVNTNGVNCLNTLGIEFVNYMKVVETLAEKYHLPYINLNNCGMNTENVNYYHGDSSSHFTQRGYYMIGRYVVKNLLVNSNVESSSRVKGFDNVKCHNVMRVNDMPFAYASNDNPFSNRTLLNVGVNAITSVNAINVSSVGTYYICFTSNNTKSVEIEMVFKVKLNGTDYREMNLTIPVGIKEWTLPLYTTGGSMTFELSATGDIVLYGFNVSEGAPIFPDLVEKGVGSVTLTNSTFASGYRNCKIINGVLHMNMRVACTDDSGAVATIDNYAYNRSSFVGYNHTKKTITFCSISSSGNITVSGVDAGDLIELCCDVFVGNWNDLYKVIC